MRNHSKKHKTWHQRLGGLVGGVVPVPLGPPGSSQGARPGPGAAAAPGPGRPPMRLFFVLLILYMCMMCMYLYYVSIQIYGTPPPPHGPWFGAVDLYFPVFYAYFCFLDLCQNWGGSYMYMIRMHAYRCDKSNDISTCNLKEFECIQEYKNNSDIFKKY